MNDKTIQNFQQLLSSTSWDEVLSENRPEHAYKYFFDKIDINVNVAFPEIYKKPSNKNMPINPWITSALLVSRKTKLKLASIRLNKPTIQNINKYKIYNYIYNKTIRRAKQIYYNSRFVEFSSNMKKTWETIREVLGRQKKKQCVPDFFEMGILLYLVQNIYLKNLIHFFPK